MELLKNKTTPAPWYALNYGGYWNIQNGEKYEDKNVLDEDQDENAEQNAILAASSPVLAEALIKLLSWSAHLPTLADEDIEFARNVIFEALGEDTCKK